MLRRMSCNYRILAISTRVIVINRIFATNDRKCLLYNPHTLTIIQSSTLMNKIRYDYNIKFILQDVYFTK